MHSTWRSLVVPHRSTTQARSSLTSLFEWEAVTLDDVAVHTKKGCLAYMYMPLVERRPPPSTRSRQTRRSM